MTAIGGIIRTDGSVASDDFASAMRHGLEIYGRDAWDEWRYAANGADVRGASATGGLANGARASGILARALLRTLPEDVHDRQPLWHAPSGTALVFDGRIDNRDEIARALDLSVAELASMADSDVAMRAVLAWDMGAAERLRGAFAFACWQPARRRLWLARDAMGHRPLFWHQSGGLLAFASMPAGLLALPGMSHELDELEVARVLMLTMHSGTQSIYRVIQRVEAGRVVEICYGSGNGSGDVRVHRFYALDPNRELRLARDDDYVEAFREALDRAVARCLRSSGPVASQLSSGFDSSTVTAVAARLLAARGERLTAYTAVPRPGFGGPVAKGREADESIAAAALVARLPNVDHVKISGWGRSVLESTRRASQLLGRPVRNPCNQPWMNAITEDAAARGAKVMLTGQCGNATISLTGRQLLQVLFAQGRLLDWWREARAIRRRAPLRGWLGLVRQSVHPLVPMWVLVLRDRDRLGSSDAPPAWSAINPSIYAAWRRAGQLEALRIHSRARSPAGVRAELIHMLERMEIGEHSTASHVRGLDLRDPTKDQDLAEFCVSVPLDQLCRAGETRWLLRRAMRDALPPEILYCPAKGIQAADWFEYLTAELPRIRAEVEALQGSADAIRLLNLNALRVSVGQWPTDGWTDPTVVLRSHLQLIRGVTVGSFIAATTAERRNTP